MRTKLNCLLVVVALAGLTGCGVLNPNRSIARNFYTKPIFTKNNIAELATTMTNLQERMTAVRTGPPDQQKPLRNALLFDMMWYSDYLFNEFKTRCFTQNAAWNTGLDLTSLGLSAAATIVAGPAAQALSATDTGVKGVQSKVSERFLMSQTMIVLITTMESRRAEVKTTLYSGMKTNYANFTIEEGVALINEYHNRGNLVDAMAHVQATMSNQLTTNHAAVVRAQRGLSSGTNSPPVN